MDFSKLEPFLFKGAIAAMAAVAVGMGAWKLNLFGNQGPVYVAGQHAVVFDVVKLANAQRKVASMLLGRDGPNSDAAGLLLDIQGRTKEAVRTAAGPGTIVFVKQAVVHSDLPDITDTVLQMLNLPRDVPTQDATTGLDYTPTVLGITPAPAFRQAEVAADLVRNNALLP